MGEPWGRRWPHRVQMRSPLLFGVGAEGGHTWPKRDHPSPPGCVPKDATQGPLQWCIFSMKWLLTCAETITSPEVDFLSSVVLGLL